MFPRRIALLISSWMGVVAFHAAVDARRLTLANLTLVYGDEKSRREINKMGRTVFRELGRNVVDAVRLPSITVENVDTLVTIEGLEHLELAYQKGRGVIAVSAHLGNFELLGSVLALKGFAVTVVAAPVYDSRLDELLMQHRVQSGLTVVNRDQAFAILRALKKGDIVGLLVDQYTRGSAIDVPFFGMPARTPIGPAILAGRVGAPIIPMAIRRQSDDTHFITIRPPLYSVGRSHENVEMLTAAYTEELERFIRKAPAQWLWMHDRWKVPR